jgi:hypothetical protein
MTESLFLVGDGNVLKKMDSTKFASENDFQQLLAQFPDLLTDADFGEGTPRRWMLVTREAPIADSDNASGRCSLDHLFLDQDAVPTLVEVKRSTDTRARREVVAQMLDYAANAISWWKIDEMRALLDKSSKEGGTTAQARLAKLLETDDLDVEAFWRSVQANLSSGRIRLLFVADHIAPELQTIIQFLNEQMQSTTVLALELRHFTNGSERILAPRLIGITPRVTARRAIVQSAASLEDWLSDVLSPSSRDSVQRYLDLVKFRGASVGVAGGSLVVEYGSESVRVSCIRSNGRASLALYQIKKFPPFLDVQSRIELLDKFAAAGLTPSTRTADGEPAFELPHEDDAAGWEALGAFISELFNKLPK